MPRAAQAAGAVFDGTPRAVIYARYSSTHQRERSIEDQIADCRAYAERCGLMVVGIYADRAISGKTDERPDFQRMIDDSKKRQFDRVIVWKLDRFARNRYDSALYKHKLKQNGVSVLSAMENIGEGDESIILEAILEASAEYYSRDLRKKVLRGMTTSAKKACIIRVLCRMGIASMARAPFPTVIGPSSSSTFSRHTQKGRRPPSYTAKCSAAASIQKSTGAR